MKLLLTSAGVRNPTIKTALIDLLGKPIEECDALCIPTASYGHHNFAGARRFVAGLSPLPMCDLGWKSIGLLELTALPTLERDAWVPVVEAADVLLAGGGDSVYLAHHMRLCGLAELMPALDNVWCGFSGGSMALAPRVGREAMMWVPPDGSDRGAGIVEFSIFPHVDHPDLPDNAMVHAEEWARNLDNPGYAIDDETAIRVVDGNVDIVTEGNWRRFD